MAANSGARSPSGQWYPQNPSWVSGATVPAAYSPAGSALNSPGGGYNSNLNYQLQQQQQQQQQRAGNNMNASTVLNNSGTWNGSTTPTPPGFGAGNGGLPGQQQMPYGTPGGGPYGANGMNGMNPNMMMMQQQPCDCCGGSQGGGCCGGPQGGGCCGGNSQQQCCGPQGGCCPMPGEPPDPYVCTSTPGNPACYECIYNCFDYTFLLAIILFILTVVGFGVVMGTKDIDDIYKKFDAHNASELNEAMEPYIIWMNQRACDSSNAGSSSSFNSGPGSESASFSNSGSHHNSNNDATTSKEGVENGGSGKFHSDAFGHDITAEHLAWWRGAAVRNTINNQNAGSVPKAEDASGSDSNSDSDCVVDYKKPCTVRHLKGSFGGICMEDNLNANVFAIQLSHWNNARDTMWFLAMVFTGFAIIYAGLIHSQRNENSMSSMNGGAMNPSMLSPEKQAELMKMTPQQQQQFIAELQQQQMGMSNSSHENGNDMSNTNVLSLQQQQMMMMRMMQQQQQGGCCGSGAVEFYDTPYYEYVRFAWGFVGLTVFVWTINLCLSFWAFSSFYVNHTDGPLREFWRRYAKKFSGSVVMVTVYLAWPLCNFGLDLVVWIVGILPWVIIRSTCKQNIGNYRPSLPLSQMPGWIRTDMFFMDFADLKRLGFSRNSWVVLTGSDRPFFDSCCIDPMIDTDPNMTSLLVQRYQFQLQMYAMTPMWMRGMMPPPMPPPQLNLTPEQFQQQYGIGQPMTGPMGMNGAYGGNLMPGANGQSPVANVSTPSEAGLSNHRHHHRDDHNGDAGKPADGVTPSTARHRRRRRSSRGGQSLENAPALQDGGATPGGHSSSGRRRRRTHADPAGEAAATPEAAPSRRKHHSRSRSRSKGLNAGEVADAGAAMSPNIAEDNNNNNNNGGVPRRSRRHSHSRSRSVSKEVAVPIAEDPLNASAVVGSKSRRHRRHSVDAAGDGGSRSRSHRHGSHSKSRSRSKSKGKSKREKKGRTPGDDLDALMQL